MCNAHPDKDKFAVSYGHSKQCASDLQRCSSLQRGLVLPTYIFLSPPEKYFLQSCLETGTFPISWSQPKTTFYKDWNQHFQGDLPFFPLPSYASLCCLVVFHLLLTALYHFTAVFSLHCPLYICSKTSGR